MKPTLKNKLAALALPGFAALALLVSTPDSEAAVYIKFEGIKGESIDTDHEGWIDILSFSQSMHRPGTSAADSGEPTPPAVKFSALRCSKELDKASPKIAEAVCLGKVIPSVTIELDREGNPTVAGSEREVYLRIELLNVKLANYSVSGTTSSGSVPAEDFSLNFEEIKVTYTEYTKEGSKGGNVEYSWKIEKGES